MLYAIVAVIALILDQAVKYWTTVNIVVDTGEAKLIPGLIHLANVHNTGAAFSFLEGARWFFVILCVIFVLIVIYALAKDLITDKVCRWAAVFVMAGAIGNCIDRIVCGYVVDMFEFDFLIFKRPFPVFNLADIFITLGVIAFCVALLMEKPGAKTKKPAASGADEAAPAAKTKTPAVRGTDAKPLIRRRQKVEIPDFPKHDLSDVPALDPNDPFAEWEKRANTPKAEPEAPVSNPVIYTQPAAAEAAQQNTVRFTSVPVEPVRPAVPAKPEAAPVRPAAPVQQPVAPAPRPVAPAVPPAVPVQPAKPAQPDADEFDLESILAEFKDF